MNSSLLLQLCPACLVRLAFDSEQYWTHPGGNTPTKQQLYGHLPPITKTIQVRRSLVWFQVRDTSCHLTSSKLAWKSTPKSTWMCWRVWWSPSVIRWQVADPGCGSRTRRRHTSSKRPRLGFRRSATTLYPSLTALYSHDLNPLDYFVWSYVENIANMTSTAPNPAWSPPSAEYLLSSRLRLWKRPAPSYYTR